MATPAMLYSSIAACSGDGGEQALGLRTAGGQPGKALNASGRVGGCSAQEFGQGVRGFVANLMCRHFSALCSVMAATLSR